MAASPSLPLFDVYQRDDDNLPLYSEDSYTFLNRVAGQEWSQRRSLLEDWFANYPEDDKDRLRKAFVANDEGTHLGAWWELYIYSLYRCLGYDVKIHPRLDGVLTTPDFLVTKDTQSKYVECTVVSALEGPTTNRPAVEAAILDAINQIRDDKFGIIVELTTVGDQPPRRRKIQADIGDWVGTLDYQKTTEQLQGAWSSGEIADLPEKEFQFNDWVLTCKAFPAPASGSASGRLLGPPARALVDRNTSIIRKAVREKGSHYGAPGSIDKPLIVAVMSVNQSAQISNAIDAMFGSIALSIPRDNPSSAELIRNEDGYWRRAGGRGSRVSAVLFSHDMRPWSVRSHLPIALINPWADQPINDHPPLSAITTTDGIQFTETPPTKAPQEVFNI